ncbi:MAG: Gfo/Idh/MocA family oxidoreductase [Prevotella sp.]|nr:Gfo/Idh/MocA family oxidoreductase [Prevotella sp.]
MKKLGIGILGLGEGRSTMSAALQSDNYELIAICDRNEQLCQQRAEEFNFHHYTTDYQDLLDDERIDVIGIYTPDHLHALHVKQALLAGKHAVCAKPFMDDLTEAKELLEISRQKHERVLIGQSSRFFEPMKRQRMDYEAGEIGEIITLEGFYNADQRWFLAKPWALQPEFKWLYGGLSHPVDFVRWYMPDIDEVMGYGMLSSNGVKGGLKNNDTMHFIFKTTDGRVARVSGCYTGPIQPVYRESEMSCILRGTEGCSQADYMDLRYAITNKDGEEKMYTWENKLKHFFRFEGKSHHAGEYQNYLDYFAECINSNTPAYPDLKEGIGTVAVLLAMDQSLKTGMPVKVDTILAKYGLKREDLV